TFNDLRIVGGNGGHGYTLQAFVPIFPTVTSSPFNIFGPTQLAFTVQPSNAKRSAIITPPIQVEVQDENGDLVTDSQYFIQLFPGNFPGFGSLQGISGRQTINGVATFNDLRIVGGVGGHGYTLQAFLANFPIVTSTPFNIFGPTQLAFTVQPSNTDWGAIITPAVQVQVQDENGAVVTDSVHFINLFPGTFPGGGSLQGLSAKQTINGVATFDDLRIVGGNGGHAYTLGAFSQGFPAISSNPFDISASPFTVTNTNDSGPGSLRQAILNANNTLNTTITFSIAGTAPFTITPLTSLPMVGPFITIDGTTQLGYTGSPIIELDGSSAGTNSRGLLLGEDVTVKGLTINRFARAGVELGGSNTVQGNYIGTDITGTFARPNGEGILINSGNNLIGGPNVAARNVISGNSQKGIKISGPNNGLNNVILGNYIGTNASGTAGVPNTIGISTSRRSIIGGTLAGEGNLIAYNSDRGVSIEAASGVSVRGNSIHSNGPIDIRVVNGIDINPTGLNTNDYCDNDTGANGRQNFPLLTTVNLVGIETRFGGILAGKPNTTYTIDFYSCVQCDRSGYGEANTYLGSGNVTTGGTCSTAGTPFSITVPGSINVDQPVVATATDEQGSTSEFSLCFAPAATIQGTVSGSFGEPIAGVLITLDREDTDPNPLPPDADFEFRTVTDQLGRFSLKNLPLGHNWRVTPIKQNFTFTPSSRAYPNLQTDHDDTYTGLFNFSSVRGKVTLNGLGLKDVTMTLTRGLLFSRVTTTSKSGNYSFPDVVWPLPGAFTVTPSRPGYVFTPASATFNLGTDDQIHDFSAATLESTLPGRILLKHGPDVFAMNADGSGSMTLLPGQHFGSDPLTYAEAVFSPAGDKIATASRDDSARLSIRNADGTAVSNIFSPSSVTALLGTSIGWSPDAGSLAFTQLVSSTQRIYRIGTNGNNLTQLTTGISMDTLSPDWSPDGSKLVFSRSGGWLYRMTTNGSNVTPLLVNGFPFNCAAVDGSATSPKWSPDGTKIAFHARCSNPMSRGIFTVDADGTNLTQVLVDNVNSMKDLDWAPGGVRLAFLRVRPPPSLSIELVSVLPDGSNPHVIDQVFDQWPYYPLDTKFDWGRDNSIPTPPGTSVNVQSGPISITYAATSGSNATTSINPINPASVGTTPGGFSIGNMAYEISTTANVTPPITVCFVVSPAAYPTQAAFSMLHILHGENGVLVPRTTFRHFPSRTICATVSSLSPFALGEQFDASLPSVSGLVLDPDGAALRDVTIALTGDEDRFTETDEEGYFRFTNLTPDGNYSVQPNSVGYLFNSPYQSYIGINGEETVVFTATAANFSIRGSVSDQDGNPLANVPITLDGTSDETTTDASGNYTLTGLPAHGSFSIAPLQSGLFFTPSQVSVQSLQNNVSEINFVSGPPPPNQSPNAANDVATTNQNTPISIVVLANDADSDGDVLTVTNTTQGSNGAVVINADNTVTYSPSAGFAGTDSFNYTISDGRGGSASATVNVTVSQVNRPPTVVVQNVTRNADANCQAVVTAQEVSGGSSDPDGDAITLTLTPAGPFGVGAHPVTVTVTDSHGASASANATVTVIDNTPPAITCPSSIVATAPPGQSSAVVNYSASATDNCSNVMVTATHPSGSTFPVGVTTVTVTATDAAGTTATCSFTVTVNGSPTLPDKIAFDTTRDGNLEIYSMNADGTNQTRLTVNSALDFKPSWSPDRSKIAFTSSRSGNGDIYVMNADGTNQTRLTSNSAIEDDASWSPDGTKIAFWSNRDGNPEIYVMN
ncbi:MAG: carboxypeptidase regulatory-like domain-containing protein, partial [Pyrinomonadaceae bacterium]|nr:carboxypeptidase regulatory-like domain-containing protein [Pyrinomonadaceae bacterium]